MGAVWTPIIVAALPTAKRVRLVAEDASQTPLCLQFGSTSGFS